MNDGEWEDEGSVVAYERRGDNEMRQRLVTKCWNVARQEWFEVD